MGPQSRHYQQLAIAVLAIASAALGFSFWTHDFDLDYPIDCDSIIQIYFWVRVASPPVAMVLFFAVLLSVGRLFSPNRLVTGADLAGGPLFWFHWEMSALSVLFLAEYIPALIMGLNPESSCL